MTLLDTTAYSFASLDHVIHVRGGTSKLAKQSLESAAYRFLTLCVSRHSVRIREIRPPWRTRAGYEATSITLRTRERFRLHRWTMISLAFDLSAEIVATYSREFPGSVQALDDIVEGARLAEHHEDDVRRVALAVAESPVGHAGHRAGRICLNLAPPFRETHVFRLESPDGKTRILIQRKRDLLPAPASIGGLFENVQLGSVRGPDGQIMLVEPDRRTPGEHGRSFSEYVDGQIGEMDVTIEVASPTSGGPGALARETLMQLKAALV